MLPEERAAIEARLRNGPQHMNAEPNTLLGQKKSVLEIHDFLSGVFDPLALAGLLGNLRAQEKLGRIKITEKLEGSKPTVLAEKGSTPRQKD